MKDDPLVDEVRRIRSELAARCHNDIRELGKFLMELPRDKNRRYVSFPPKRPSPSGHAVVAPSANEN
jgi:hypothetical protein